MRAGPRVPALLVALLVVATLAVPVVPAAAQSAAPPPERTTVTVTVQANGDARWNVSTYFEVDSESDREAFERLRNRFESGDVEATYDLETFRRAVETVDGERSRSMALVGAGRSSGVGNGTGRLTLTFRWTNFAVSEGERLRVGDPFNTSEEWLPGLASRQRLVIVPPGNYGIFEVPDEPDIEQGSVVYEGPTTFERGDLDIVFQQTNSPTPTDSPTDSRTDSRSPSGPNGEGFDLSQLLVFGLLAVGIGAVALGAYLRDREGEGPPPADGPEDPGDPSGGAASTAGDEGDEVDLELLSDEERVEYLLEQNGGRMKQANIVKETGWSNAKVSQLLSAMAEEERVDKLRIGRENLISLPDEDVASLDDEE